MITVKFPRHHSMSVRTSAAQIRAVTDTLILQEAVCAGFQLISTHSPCSRIGSKFRTYFMLIWILKILPTGHGFARIQKKAQTMQIVFCWILLCFDLVWFLLDSPLLCLSCRVSHFHTLHSDKTVLTEVILMPSSPGV